MRRLSPALGLMREEMNQSIVVHVQCSYGTAYRACLRLIMLSPIRLINFVIFPVAGFYLIYIFIKNHYIPSTWNILVVIFALGFTPINLGLSLFLIRRKNTLGQVKSTYEFTEDGMRTYTELADSSFKWVAVQRVIETKSFMFFFVAPNHTLLLPLKALKTDENLRALRELVKHHVKVVKSFTW